MDNMLGKAIAYAAEKFKDKKDRGGQPYILHCLHVMYNSGPDPVRMAAAVLHDVLEDIEDLTQADLLKEGFPQRVVDLVWILTKRPGEDYENVIKRASMDPDAKIIKRADLEHNSQLSRLKGLTKDDFERMEKYHKAYVYLS